MSSDKEKLTQMLQKVEEISATLSKISEDLRLVSTSLKSLAVSQITSSPPHAQTHSSSMNAYPSTVSSEVSKQRSIEDIRMSFPEELETRLNFEEKGEFIIIKPKQFLGSENFAKIASAVRGMGGEYISLGKDSHFRVPKKKT